MAVLNERDKVGVASVPRATKGRVGVIKAAGPAKFAIGRCRLLAGMRRPS